MGIINSVGSFFRRLISNKSTVSSEEENLLEWLGVKTRKHKEVAEATYFTCLRLLSETLGKMPLKYFQSTSKGKIRAEPDELTRLLTVRPNPVMTPTTFWSTVEANRQHFGNAYVWVQRAVIPGTNIRRGVHALWIMPSNQVQVLMDNEGVFAEKGRLYYQYSDSQTGQIYMFPQEDVLHFKTSMTFDGILGKPVRKIVKDLIDGAKSGQEYTSNLGKNGLSSVMTLEYSEDLDKTRRTKLQTAYNEYLSGARTSNGVIPLPPGLSLKPVSMKLTDAQFYELRKYTALQIAAAFGIKPNQLNNYEKSSYANSETQQLAFLVETMAYPLKSYEEEINYKLLTELQLAQGYWYRFNEKAVLRTDAKTQAEIIASYVNNGVYTANEARDLLQLPAKDGGDVLMVNGNYIPITEIGKQYGTAGGENE